MSQSDLALILLMLSEVIWYVYKIGIWYNMVLSMFIIDFFIYETDQKFKNVKKCWSGYVLKLKYRNHLNN